VTLELDGVEKRYDDFSLGPVSLSVREGVTAVLGPSGSGKSTLLGTVAGFAAPDAGHVRLGERPLDGLPPEDRNVGVVFQDYALFPHLTVRQNLAFGTDEGDRAVEDEAAQFEIDHLLDRRPETLSGGEKQRVALARTLLSDPDVLLLDEPLANLDEPIRRRLRFELRETLATLDIPVVYVTHDQDEAAIVADRVAIMNDGRIVQSGPKARVFNDPETAFVADFVGMENVVPGQVAGHAAGGTLVDVGSTTVVAAGDPACDDVSVAIHPEAIDVLPAPDSSSPADVRADGDGISRERDAGGGGGTARASEDGPPTNRLPATVVQVVAHRRAQTARLRCAGDVELVARLRDPADRIRAGQRVLVTVPPQDVHLVRS
jgi:molybdate/tungstate transport system ATP-binding protein